MTSGSSCRADRGVPWLAREHDPRYPAWTQFNLHDDISIDQGASAGLSSAMSKSETPPALEEIGRQFQL